MNPDWYCSFDGVSEAAEITAASTATGSGGSIVNGSASRPLALASSAIRGARGARFEAASGTDEWISSSFSASGSVSVRAYFRIDSANPITASADIVHIRNSGRAVSARLTTGRVLQVVDAGSTVRMTSGTALADGDYVISIAATKGTTTSNGRIAAWLRSAVDDSTVVTPIDASTYNTGTTDYSAFRFGKTSGTGDLTIDMDEVAGAYSFGEIDRISAYVPTPGTLGDTLTYSMNRIAGTLVNGVPRLSATGAANVYAGTTGLDLVGALNSAAANTTRTDKDLAGVLNQLAGTTGLDAAGAASQIDA